MKKVSVHCKQLNTYNGIRKKCFAVYSLFCLRFLPAKGKFYLPCIYSFAIACPVYSREGGRTALSKYPPCNEDLANTHQSKGGIPLQGEFTNVFSSRKTWDK